MTRFKASVAIANLSFFAFYAGCLYSFLLPCALPDSARHAVMYSTFSIFSLALGYCAFIYRVRPFLKDGSKVSIFALIKTVLAIIAFSSLMAFSMQRVLAYPTKLFAQRPVVERFRCVSVETWGKARRGVVLVKGALNSGGDSVSFPWSKRLVPTCPGDMNVKGRRGVLGMYVDELAAVEAASPK